MKRSKSKKIAILNLFGSVGYVTCVFQWLWMLLILLPSALQSPLLQSWLGPTSAAPTQPVAQTSTGGAEVPEYLGFLALVLGVALVLWILYLIVTKIPRSIADSGEKVTHTVARTIAPVIIEHVSLPEKQRREVPAVIILVLKLIGVFAPLGLLLFAQGITIALSFEAIMFIGIILFSWAFLFFVLQFAASKLLGVDYGKVR